MDTKILIIPGYGGSGKDHWQTYWEKEIQNSSRVEQEDWNDPQLDLWVKILDSYIHKNCTHILVAHSLACSLVAHWASSHDTSSVLGALVVSASDVDSSEYTPDKVRNFSPMPTNKLPFESIVVASENDPSI
jgi:predicted alpha/beta hydrolase family esterase